MSLLMDFPIYFNASQNCPSPVIPVDDSRELPKSHSKRFQDNRQLMIICIYEIFMVSLPDDNPGSCKR